MRRVSVSGYPATPVSLCTATILCVAGLSQPTTSSHAQPRSTRQLNGPGTKLLHKWVGKPLPLIDYIDIGPQLRYAVDGEVHRRLGNRQDGHAVDVASP